MDTQLLIHIALVYGVLLVSLVFHEAAHALLALLGGDKTAYVGGQVTLNPGPHIRREPFGTVILPLAMLFYTKGAMTFGFAHAPVDPTWARRHPPRAALMSAAGPLANVLLALAGFAVLKALVLSGLAEPYQYVNEDRTLWLVPTDGSRDGPLMATIRIASTFVLLNVVLGLLNLFPLPPFDGAGVVEGLVPPARRLYDTIRAHLPLVIAGLAVVWFALDKVLVPVLGFVYRQL